MTNPHARNAITWKYSQVKHMHPSIIVLSYKILYQIKCFLKVFIKLIHNLRRLRSPVIAKLFSKYRMFLLLYNYIFKYIITYILFIFRIEKSYFIYNYILLHFNVFIYFYILNFFLVFKNVLQCLRRPMVCIILYKYYIQSLFGECFFYYYYYAF